MKHVIHTSERKDFKRCRQLWDMRSPNRLAYEPKRPDWNLAFGTAVHAGLEVYYDPATWAGDRTAVEVLALIAFVKALPPLEEDSSDDDIQQWEEWAELGKGMLKHYFQWAPKVDTFTPKFAEIKFEVPIDEGLAPRYSLDHLDETPLYAGRIDAIVEDKEGGLWIMDHKTAGRFDPEEFLVMDEQVTCVPTDTQALTKEGWKYYKELKIGDEILAYNRGSCRTEWTPIEALSVHEDQEVGILANSRGDFKVACTPNHRWVGEARCSHDEYAKIVQWETEAQKLPASYAKLHLAATGVEGTLPITPDEAAFIGWVLTDGSVRVGGKQPIGGTYYHVTLSQAAHKFADEIQTLIDRLGYVASKNTVTSKLSNRPCYVWQFSSATMRELWRRAGLKEKSGIEQFVLGLSQEALTAFVNAGMMGDGTARDKHFCQSDGEVKEGFRLAFFLMGYYPTPGNDKGFSFSQPIKDTRTLRFEMLPNRERVWCPQTKFGTWVMKQDRTICITGNSYCWAVQHMLGVKVEGFIYNELRKDVPHRPNVLKNGMLSKAKDQNTTFDLYLTAIREQGYSVNLYSDILEHLQNQGNKFFRRTYVRRSPRELELAGERIALEAADMLSNPSIYPNPDRHCTYCSFRAPCLARMDGSDPNWILEGNYIKKENEDAN